ncbi:MAG TPA: winged helix-turn-helix domain-containing protein [Trebonia sp.]|nr:winged helix-turn-helix domain-containing protein [Trebonia sp.]
MGVTRLELSAQGLGSARFALGPLNIAGNLLQALRLRPLAVDPVWRARSRQVIRDHDLRLLGLLGGGGPHGYAPDFVRPEPPSFDSSPDAACHAIATAAPERVRYEMAKVIGGSSWDDTPAGRAPRLLLDSLERGEAHLARRAADQMWVFWRHVLAPHWPRMREHLEHDVTRRATVIAREGAIGAITGLAPNLSWNDGGLDFRTASACGATLQPGAVVFVPCPFIERAVFCGGEPAGAPAPRLPLICYPAVPTAASPFTRELIGSTRTRVLAALDTPRTTADLAQWLHLSYSTVSYHLQILNRAGLVRRTRHSLEVRYQRH